MDGQGGASRAGAFALCRLCFGASEVAALGPDAVEDLARPIARSWARLRCFGCRDEEREGARKLGILQRPDARQRCGVPFKAVHIARFRASVELSSCRSLRRR